MLAGAACVAATPFYGYGPGAFTVVDWVSYAGLKLNINNNFRSDNCHN